MPRRCSHTPQQSASVGRHRRRRRGRAGRGRHAATGGLRRSDHHDQRRHRSASDRPNLSKDYLAGEAQEDWIPLWPPEFYAERRIDLRARDARVVIDLGARTVLLDDGSRT